MSILFVDGFDHSGSVAEKGYAVTNSVTYTTTRRTGTRALAVNGGSSGLIAFAQKTVTTGDSFRIALAFYLTNGVSGTRNAIGLVTLRDGSTDQMTVRVNTDTTISIVRGSPGTGTVLGTTVGTYNNATWYHLELLATIANSGSATLWSDGTEVLTLTGIDNQATANAQATSIILGSTTAFGGNSFSALFDDVIFATGAQPRIGTATVQTLYPNGAGTTTQWTASAGTNVSTVDEATANSDTDYVSTSTAGNIDTYAFGNLTVSADNIIGVAVNVVARDDAGGSPSIAAMVRSGGTDYAQTSVATTATYANYQAILATDPATSAAWTEANVNAAEFGVKRI